LTPNLERQGEILKEGNILSLALEVTRSCSRDFKPHTQTFYINNIYPYSLKENIDLQFEKDVHEIFHFS